MLGKRRSEEEIDPEPEKKRICIREKKPKFIPAKRDQIKENMVVLAHLQTYSEWPAKILQINKLSVKVFFFGDHLTANLKHEKIGLIGENAGLIKCLLKKNIKDYKKSVLEMERVQNVPVHLSIVNL